MSTPSTAAVPALPDTLRDAGRLSFPGKVVLSAAAGASMPLLFLFFSGAAYEPAGDAAPLPALRFLYVVALGTLFGVALSAWLLSRLVAPVLRAGHALERFLQAGEAPDPSITSGAADDEAGRLLRDVALTVRHCTNTRQTMERRSHTDPLTGLPDRRAAVDRLVAQVYKAERASLPVRFCAVVVAADGLKAINERFGHDSGDAVLKTVGRHLQQGVEAYARAAGALADADVPTLAATDSWVARWCGAEFLVVLRGGVAEAEKLVEDLRRTLPEVYQVGGAVAIRFTLSAGAAPYRVGETPGQLLRNAETALEEAKEGGRDCFRVASRQRRQLALTSGDSTARFRTGTATLLAD